MKHSASSHLPHDMPETFAKLNDLHRLRPINDKVDLDNATEVMDRLAILDKRTPDQAQYLDTLIILIERYEAEHESPIGTGKVKGLRALKHLMEANEMIQSGLADLLGVGASSLHDFVRPATHYSRPCPCARQAVRR